jgi:mono/diheme cytochrome c family protein
VAGSRRWSRQATIGVALIAGGLVIAALFFGLTLPSGSPFHPGGSLPRSYTPAQLGQRIYTTGTDQNGNVIPRSAYMMFAGATCAQCHGNDAQGRTINSMMGSFQTPDIRWSTLSRPMTMDGQTEPPYDPTSFGRALTQGIGSAGDALKVPMPRWDLTTEQIQALIAFLKTK